MVEWKVEYSAVFCTISSRHFGIVKLRYTVCKQKPARIMCLLLQCVVNESNEATCFRHSLPCNVNRIDSLSSVE